jgi:hypothetical protein
MSGDLGPWLLCGGGLLVLGILIGLPVWLVRKGFDLVAGCLGNLVVIVVAAVLLVALVVVADVDICQVWLVGEALCAIIHSS